MTRFLLLALAFLSFETSAWAHAFLTGAAPSAGSRVTSPPPDVTLQFSEPVEPRFSTVEVLDPAGQRITTETPRSASGNARVLIVVLPRLVAGTYTVVWHVTSVDTHKTEGRYQFTVGP